MSLWKAVLVMGVAHLAACGGDDGADRSPREACQETEAAINVTAKECDPQHGTIVLTCTNFGTGTSCGVIEDYFACLSQVTCDNGTVVVPSNCQLGACD